MKKDRDYIFYKLTKGVCHECGELVNAQIIFKDNEVYLRKLCPTHGHTTALIERDVKWYIESLNYTKQGTIPLHFSTEVKNGCPSDCGLCPDHQQHTCMPVIEITDHCNLNCPICIINSQNRFFMNAGDFQKIIENLIRCEGTLEVINLSGGEPTLHPNFRELIELSIRPEILKVSVSTNGITLAEDDSLLEYLQEKDVVISLQLDGFNDEVYQKLRGQTLLDTKMRLLEKLKKNNVKMSITYTLARGINEAEVKDVLNYFFENENVIGLVFQPIAYEGRGREFKHNPSDRITILDTIRLIEKSSRGRLKVKDFVPLPCSYPSCFALTHLLKLGDKDFIPISRLVNLEIYLDIIKNRTIPGLEQESFQKIKDNAYKLYSSAGMILRSQKVLRVIKELISDFSVFKKGCCSPQEALKIGEKRVKTISIHSFMDKETFDLTRAMKCCSQYPLSDGRLIPCCVYNVLYRK